MRKIPFGRPMIGEEEKKAVMDVLDGPILVHGPRAAEFEQGFSRFTGAPRAVAVSSCTAAMHLAWFHLGLGPGDEVLVSAQTHAATAHAVEFCGARPVFVDAEPGTGNIDPDRLAAAVTPRTRGVALVHFMGTPADMVRVMETALRHGLFVLEDCALALGARQDGVHVGLLGQAGCFSFYPVKHMTTAEGGMLITRDPDLAERIARKKAFGVDRTPGERKIPGVYDVTELGYNYRMNEIQAAIGIEQLKKMDFFLEQRKENFKALAQGLSEIEELKVLGGDGPHGRTSAHYGLSALLSPELRPKRFEIVRLLNEQGVGTSVYYPRPVPLLTYYREKYGYSEDGFPVASAISNGSIALPVGPHLDREDMAYIAQTLKQAVFKVRNDSH